MEVLEQVRELCGDYLNRCRQLELDRKPGDGLLGMGSGPDKDPCHDAFARELETVLKGAEGRPSDEIRAALSYLYRIPTENRDNLTAYWMLLAVHGLTVELAAGLNRSDAAALLAEYREEYPRWERLPAQKRVLAALKAQAAMK